MLIRVRFFGDLREYTKKRWMTIDVDQGSSVRDFLFELSKNIDASLLEKLMERDEVGSGIRILLNGRSITHLKGLETSLSDRDLITIMPIAGGG